MGNVINSLKEYISWIFASVNQVDCPDEISINEMTEEQQTALRNVENFEKELTESKQKNKDIKETVIIDPKVVKKMQEKVKEKSKQTKQIDDSEREI